MNLNCVICTELFIASDDAYVTVCGHMFHHRCLSQWFQRSKTCPQCRNKCSERNIHKIYFNLANLDTSKIDVGSLQQQLEGANLKVKVTENDLKKSQDEIKSLKEVQKKSIATISSLEKKLKESSFLIFSYNERIKMLQVDQKEKEAIQNQIKKLKDEIKLMEGVSAILSSTSVDTDNVLQTESDPKRLASWVAVLKRELRTSESKKVDIRNVLQVVKYDYRQAHDLNKMYAERISLLESANYDLTEKLKSLECKQKCSNDDVMMSPIPLNPSKRKLGVLESLNNPSPGISEKVKRIEESDSPYLNIKSSSIGLGPLLKLGKETHQRKKQTISKMSSALKQINNEQTDKYSIFQKARANQSTGLNKLNTTFVFNGVGGSEKKDEFDNLPYQRPDAEDKTKNVSNRLKSGKLRKFPSAGRIQ